MYVKMNHGELHTLINVVFTLYNIHSFCRFLHAHSEVSELSRKYRTNNLSATRFQPHVLQRQWTCGVRIADMTHGHGFKIQIVFMFIVQ